MRPIDLSTRVVENVRYAPGSFSLRVRAPEVARAFAPGQFVMIGIEAGLRPYLRRAFSVADAQGEEIEILVKTVGVGTAALEEAPEGAKVRLLGPLGKAFDLEAARGGTAVMVAGGIGVAPFLGAARELVRREIESKLFFGGRTASDLVAADRLGAILGPDNVLLSTDDGSRGFAGRVTGALERALDAGLSVSRLYACGPEPMFAALSKIVAARGIASEFSMEREMACGFGVCLGCVVPTVDGRWATLCKEGPAVDPAGIDWSRMHATA